MSTPTATLSTRVWSYSVQSDAAVTGMTTGLNEAACFPQRLTIHEHGSGNVTATLDGPRARKDGTQASAWVSVKVTITETDGGWRGHYPQAPQWISDVYQAAS